MTRVAAIDLEEELEHVRDASKTPVGEILMDVRQARKGLRQVKEELARMLAEEEKEGETERYQEGAGEQPPSSFFSSSSSGETAGGGDAKCANGGGRDRPGVDKLSGFAEEAEVRLASIEWKAKDCVGLCKGLGEFFGEGADEAQSAHILRTLVQFMDMVAMAKKVEGLC